MPGIDLNLDLPTLEDNFAVIVAKLVTALEAIEADLAPRIPAGALDITTALDLGGAPLVNAGGVRLMGGESTVPGTMYMDDELRVMTAYGAVQITNNGALNIAGSGGIGGDYGSGAEAVTYHAGSREYRFNTGPGQWGHVACDDVVLKSAAGTHAVRLGASDTLGGSLSIFVQSLPATGVGLLAYRAATSELVDATSVAISQALKLNSLEVNDLTVTGSFDAEHTNTWRTEVPYETNFMHNVDLRNFELVGQGAWSWQSQTLSKCGLRVGDRVRSVRLRISKGIGPASIRLKKINDIGDDTTMQTWTTTQTGNFIWEESVTAPFAIAAGERWFLELEGPLAGDVVRGLAISWDHP